MKKNNKASGNRKTDNKEHLNEYSLSLSLEDNIKLFRDIFRNDDTLVTRYLDIPCSGSKGCFVYIDGMVDTQTLSESIIKPILDYDAESHKKNAPDVEQLMNKVVASVNVKKTDVVDEIISAILYGDTAFVIDGSGDVLLLDTKGWEKRAIEEPTSEKVLRGPREGFTESILVNLTMIRRRLQTTKLKFLFKRLGQYSKTKVCICYIEGMASEKILTELVERLDKIDIDGVLDSNYIQELIKDEPLSPFKTIGNTERPDVVAAKLLEGRFAVIVDGSPSALTLPFLFIEYFQVNEDYYQNYIFSSINRLLRIIAAYITISTPAFYVGLTTYQQEMIPEELLFSISASRRGVPFPTIVEAVVMILIFELLREAGTRMPESIGQTVNIVGALVLGKAAVEARFVSSPIIIVTALTGITGLITPKIKGPIISLRFILLFLSAVLGLYGYTFGVMGLFIHLFSMRSFGIPYMLRLGSLRPEDVKDTVVRAPLWFMYFRPQLLSPRNPLRRSKGGR